MVVLAKGVSNPHLIVEQVPVNDGLMLHRIKTKEEKHEV